MSKIDLTINREGLAHNIQKAKENNIIIPTIAQMLKTLDKLKLRDNTLVIFASDNGAAVQAPLKLFNCNAGFRGRKAQLYEGGIRVQFIVNHPHCEDHASH